MAARGSQGSVPVPYLLRRGACRGQSWVPVQLLGPKRGGVCEMTQGVSPLPQVPPAGWLSLPQAQRSVLGSSAEVIALHTRVQGHLIGGRAFRWPMGVQGL